MSSSMMRPGNFRHDMRGPRVVEIGMSEYLRSKRSILRKIRRRLIILGIIIGLTALVSVGLGVVVLATQDKIVKFRSRMFNVMLRDTYFIHGAGAILFIFHGFYIDGHWRNMQKDGNRLVLHLRLYSVLGLVALLLALWLGASTLRAFGLVEVGDVFSSNSNIIYLVTLIDVCVHLIVSPWLLRTIHRKASQADEYFGAEFMDEVKQRSRRSDRSSDERDLEAEIEVEVQDDVSHRGHVAPMRSSRGRNHQHDDDDDDPDQIPVPSPTRNRRAFFNPDGSSSVAPPARGSPRVSARGTPAYTATSPRVPPAVVSSATSAVLETDDLGRPASGRRGVKSVSATNVHTTQVPDGLITASAVSDAGQIPFASPVFLMDEGKRLSVADFWRLWKQTDTTGSFSCLFKNHPQQREVKAHMHSHGFQIVAIEVKDSVLQVYFYGHQLGTDVFFLGEFVFIYSRRYFQATFKCKEPPVASDFVTRFNLQELLVVDE